MTKWAAVLGWILCGASSLYAMDYYVDPAGNNAQDGSQQHPWQTINYAVGATAPGDTIHLAPGATFHESVLFYAPTGGAPNAPKRLISDPANRAIIRPPSATAVALTVYNTGNLRVEQIRFLGAGMDDHEAAGVNLYADDALYADIQFTGCEFSQFGAQGFYMGSWSDGSAGFSDVLIDGCSALSNRTCGIFVYGKQRSSNRNITIRDCEARYNLGDPAAPTHTGSGIILSGTTGGVIERCVAAFNGLRCTTQGGPVGIWTYFARRITIQHCEAYRNDSLWWDGGGFDIDGGVLDSTIQYCYSHDNGGPGFLLAQYEGASSFSNNVIRYCISENDGKRAGAEVWGGIHIWSSGSGGGIQDSQLYGNTIYNAHGPALMFNGTTGQQGTRLWNNIFVTSNAYPVIWGDPSTNVARFVNNAYWASGADVACAGGFSLEAWRQERQQERLDGVAAGWWLDPQFQQAGGGGTVDDAALSSLSAYTLSYRSPLIDRGLAAQGGVDFSGHTLPQGVGFDLGACEALDGDADGLPDCWERAYWENETLADATSDADADGYSDLQEFRLGSDPRSAQSHFELTLLTPPGRTPPVYQWPSAPGRLYQFESTTNLLTEFAPSAPAQWATPPLNVHTGALQNLPQQFHRLQLLR